jgi:hypothetical protein
MIAPWPWKSRAGQRIDPLAGTGRPSNLSAPTWRESWGTLGYHDYPERDSVQPDIRNYIFPSGVGRGWPDRQRLNGVSQLDVKLAVPRRVEYRDKRGKVVHGAAPLPYWQSSQAHVNQDLVQRFGGTADQIPGPIQTQQWHDALYAGIPSTGGPTGGPGTLSVVAAMRSRFGF